MKSRKEILQGLGIPVNQSGAAPIVASQELLQLIPHKAEIEVSVKKMIEKENMPGAAFGILGSRLHDLLQAGDPDKTQAAFNCVEKLLTRGDAQTQELIVSMLDDLKNIMIMGEWSKPAPDLKFLGPLSSIYWNKAHE